MPNEQKTTYTSGYFNSNNWPIQLFISKHNLQLLLQPGQFITDSNGQRINDPLFDNYKQLSKELSKQPVPLTAIPEAPPLSRLPGGQAVYGTDQVTTNAAGRKVPVMPTTPPPVPTAINASSVRGMSIEDARKAGLIGKVRVVPEDYGVNDTDGAPRSAAEVPPMKFSHESQPKVQTAGQLSEGLVNAVTTAKGDQGARRGLQQALAQGTRQTPAMITATGYVAAAKAKVAQATQVVTTIPAAPVAPEPSMPEPVDDSSDMPEDSIFAEDAVPASIDNLLPAAAEDVVEETIPITQAVKPIKPPPIKRKFACVTCEDSFMTRAQYVDHVRAKHPNESKSLLAVYPVNAGQ